MEIGKPAATGGPESAALQGRDRDTGRTGEAKGDRGECKPNPIGHGTVASSAKLEISAEGRDRAERQEALQLAKDRYDNIPEVRQEVIARVKERLAEGFYDSERVQLELGRRLSQVIKRWPS